MKINDNKWIAIVTVALSALILIYCAYKQTSSLDIMFGIFMASGLGYRASKGVIDLKRDQLSEINKKED